jgi:hypothetical protein
MVFHDMANNAVVLIVFGGSSQDASLACSFVAFLEHFKLDPACDVTGYSNIPLEPFLEKWGHVACTGRIW